MVEHILVPVDSSASAWRALDYVLDEHPEKQYTVLHVVDLIAGGRDTAGRQDARAHAEKIVKQATDVCLESGLDEDSFDVITKDGKPAATIVRVANERNVDQIVMGSRGLSDVDKLLLGSVAETVVRRASCPVNVIR